MKRTLSGRLGALLWALAFVLGTTGEGYGLHPCPHHGSPGADTHAASAAHAGHHHGAAAHDTAADGTTDQGAPAESHSGPCTCGSACQAGASIVVAAPPPPTLQLSPATAHAPRLAASTLAPVGRPPFFLPLAQAPPRSGRA